MTGALTIYKRSNKQLRKLFKECTTLNNNKIKEELQKEDSTEYKSMKDNQLNENPSMLAVTNQTSPNSNRYSPIKWENIIPKELLRKQTILSSEEIYQGIGPDEKKTNYKELDQEDFPAIDQTMINRPINPLDEEYGTQ